ncbi:unnamed protein product [Strongylus vulgaris]|uniref:Uncharacterized protein n=1 Tax=Strongylus vulgaris TaxID=40348 RepID=A0A3P7J8Z8_STRVU|nr:unnamed protein product [Strongylus vulgaris]
MHDSATSKLPGLTNVKAHIVIKVYEEAGTSVGKREDAEAQQEVLPNREAHTAGSGSKVMRSAVMRQLGTRAVELAMRAEKRARRDLMRQEVLMSSTTKSILPAGGAV